MLTRLSFLLIVVRISFGGCPGMLLTHFLARNSLAGGVLPGSPALGGAGLTSCPKLEETGGHRKTPPKEVGLNTNGFRDGNALLHSQLL